MNPTPYDRAQEYLASVSANDLAKPVKPIEVPQPQVAEIPKRQSQLVTNITRDTDGFITAQTETAKKRDEVFNQYAALNQGGSLSDLFKSTQADYGVDSGTFKELKDIQLQLNDMDTASEVRKTQIAGAGGQTLGQAGREVTQEDRENAVRSSGLAARAAVLQGNIQTAMAAAKDAVTIAYQDRTLQSQNLINQIEMLQGRVDDQTAQMLEQEKRNYEADIAKVEELKSAVSEAMVSGASQNEIAQLTDPNISDEQKLALAQSITARGATEMRNLDIAQANASLANTYSQIADRKERLQLAKDAASLDAATAQAEGIDEQTAKSEKALGMLASINEIATHPGFSAAVGPNPLARIEYGVLMGPFTGLFTGNKSEFKSEVDLLANTLTLENMDLLKGPATDKDVEIVAASMSRLKNMDVSEKGYMEELGRLQAAAQRIVDEVGVTPEQAAFYGLADEDTLNEANALWGNTQSTQSIGSSFAF